MNKRLLEILENIRPEATYKMRTINSGHVGEN